MRVEKYRNNKGNRKYVVVKESISEKIDISRPKAEKPENIRTKEESKRQNEIKQEIFEIINDYIYSGRSTLELIEKLNSEEKFKKYGQYFASWIEDSKSKYEMLMKTVERERKLGKSDEEIFEKIVYNHKFRVQRKNIKELLLKNNDKNEKGIEH